MTLPEKPFSRKEQYLAKIAGEDTEIPEKPFSREEMYLDAIAQGGGGGGAVSSVNGKTGVVVLDATDVGAATTANIDSVVKKNAGAPTTSTVGTKGQLLEDTTNGKLYQCTDITSSAGVDTEAGLTSKINNVTFTISNATTLNSKLSGFTLTTGVNYAVAKGAGNSFVVTNFDTSTNIGTLAGINAANLANGLGVTPNPAAAWLTAFSQAPNGTPFFTFKMAAGLLSYTWTEVGGGGGASVKELTPDDYNYPGNNPSSVALWLLPAGVYYVNNASSLTTTVKVHSNDTGLYYNCSFFEVTPLPQTSYILINVYGNFNSGDGDGYYGFRQYQVGATGSEQGHVVYVNNTELAELRPNSINPGYYDYPTNSPNGVAIWNLIDGNYKIDATEDYPIKLYFETTTAMDVCWGELYVKTLIDGNKFVNFEYLTYQQNNYSCEKGWCRINTSTGTLIEMKMYTEESV